MEVICCIGKAARIAATTFLIHHSRRKNHHKTRRRRVAPQQGRNCDSRRRHAGVHRKRAQTGDSDEISRNIWEFFIFFFFRNLFFFHNRPFVLFYSIFFHLLCCEFFFWNFPFLTCSNAFRVQIQSQDCRLRSEIRKLKIKSLV